MQGILLSRFVKQDFHNAWPVECTQEALIPPVGSDGMSWGPDGRPLKPRCWRITYYPTGLDTTQFCHSGSTDHAWYGFWNQGAETRGVHLGCWVAFLFFIVWLLGFWARINKYMILPFSPNRYVFPGITQQPGHRPWLQTFQAFGGCPEPGQTQSPSISWEFPNMRSPDIDPK